MLKKAEKRIERALSTLDPHYGALSDILDLADLGDKARVLIMKQMKKPKDERNYQLLEDLVTDFNRWVQG